jgi:hypothetical protein
MAPPDPVRNAISWWLSVVSAFATAFSLEYIAHDDLGFTRQQICTPSLTCCHYRDARGDGIFWEGISKAQMISKLVRIMAILALGMSLTDCTGDRVKNSNLHPPSTPASDQLFA